MSAVSESEHRRTPQQEAESAEEIRRLFERYREMAARTTPRSARRFRRVTTPQKLRSPMREPGRFAR